MISALAVILPLVLGAVFVASGIAKLVRPDDLTGWAELGVPRALRRAWLLRVHPWAEIALGVALAVLGGLLGVAAAVVAAAILAVYLVMVVRLVRRPDDASCACFGARKTVTAVTVVRNAWLLALAVGAVAAIGVTPLWGGAIAAAAGQAAWVAGLVIAAVTVGVILWPESSSRDERHAGSSSAGTPSGLAEGESATVDGSVAELDYVRVRTPSVPVVLADGATVNLRQLAMQKPLLLLAVTHTCGSCQPVIDKVAEYRNRLPELDLRLLLTFPPEVSPLTETGPQGSLHDVHDYVRGSIADWATPTAVLFGADGMLAGGPESGAEAIEAFIDDIRASLDEAIAQVPATEKTT